MREEELFYAALAKSVGERAAFLDQACDGNDSLRAAVEALLVAHERPGSFLNSPPPAAKLLDDLAATHDSEVAAEEKTMAMEENLTGSGGGEACSNSQYGDCGDPP